MTSLVFGILWKVYGVEHKGKVLALMPFVPYDFIVKLTARGVDWQHLVSSTNSDGGVQAKQVASFLFVYLLTTFSVKYYVGKLFGTQAPENADGITAIAESPKGKRFLRSMGVDPDAMKQE